MNRSPLHPFTLSPCHPLTNSYPRRMPAPHVRPEDRQIIRVLRAVNICFCRIYHRLTVHSPHQLPRSGPAILVCNHVSGLDPLLVQSVCPRVITWMIAREYYEVRGLNWVFKQVGLIPVERTGRDLSATRAAMRVLAHGAVLGVFPEGRIEPTRELLPFQTGVALMAIKTKVPVFPAWVEGTQRGEGVARAVLTPCTASVAFGPAVDFDRSSTSREALDAATQKIANAVKDLRSKHAGAELR